MGNRAFEVEAQGGRLLIVCSRALVLVLGTGKPSKRTTAMHTDASRMHRWIRRRCVREHRQLHRGDLQCCQRRQPRRNTQLLRA